MEVVWVVSAGSVALAPEMKLQAPPVYLYRTARLTSSVVVLGVIFQEQAQHFQQIPPKQLPSNFNLLFRPK